VFSLFSLFFFREIISEGRLIFPEILGFRRLDNRKNSESLRCFLLFPFVLVAKPDNCDLALT